MDATFTTANPNWNEWTLIKLTPTDVTSAVDGLGTKVAVLDGKADCRHTALAGRCVNYAVGAGTYVNYNTHGTHVTGIVGANPYGIAPAATVLNYGVYADSGWVATGTLLSDTWKAANAAGANISSMSFGCTGKALCFSAYDLSTMASSNLGMLFVKAAGNNGTPLINETTAVSATTAQAALNKTLIVGSVNASGVISSFSNRAADTCLLAGGATVCSEGLKWRNHFLVAPGEGIYSTMPNGGLGGMSGTSMATPVVAGVAALLQTRWPALKTSPETLAKILLTSATDLGDPGVDSVYGYGLLNAERAFSASGTVTIVTTTTSTTGSTTTTSGSTTTTTTTTSTSKGNPKRKSLTSGSLGNLAAAIGSVTVFDEFGRDFRMDETSMLDVRRDFARQRGIHSRRLLGAFTQESWAPAFFAPKMQMRSFGLFGSPSTAPGMDTPYDRSLRAGVDLPLGKTAVQLRLSGPTNPRTDLSYDPSLRPLAFFPSTNLATNSLISNVLIPAGNNARVMLYGSTTAGTVEAQNDISTQNTLLGHHLTALRSGQSQDVSRSQSAIGVGYWKQIGSGTIIGVNASTMSQRNGFLDITTNLDGFDRPSRLFNLGFAVSRASAGWDLTASAEVTHARMSAAGQTIAFTPTTLASAEIAVAKNGVIAKGSALKDTLRASFMMPPRAVSGSLQLQYMTVTPDGLNLQAARRRINVNALGHEPMRFESAYQVSAADKWSLSLSGGVDVEKGKGGRAAEALISFRANF